MGVHNRNILVTKIMELYSKYGVYSELLPEELLDETIERKLTDHKSNLENIIGEDLELIKNKQRRFTCTSRGINLNLLII